MRRAGFTILEIVLVLAVLLLLAAITLPSIEAMYGDLRLTAAADLVRARWADARARAVEDGVPYRFAVKPGSGHFRVAPDVGDFWAGGNGGSLPESDTPPLVIEGELPKGVTFSEDSPTNNGDQSGEWTTRATFLADATAKEDVQLTFHAIGARPLIVRLRALTGAVTVQYENQNGGSP